MYKFRVFNSGLLSKVSHMKENLGLKSQSRSCSSHNPVLATDSFQNSDRLTRADLINEEEFHKCLVESVFERTTLRSKTKRELTEERLLLMEQAKLVAPDKKQSPISIQPKIPIYNVQNKPLILKYPPIAKDIRLNNTGFSWELKMPYKIGLRTQLKGAHLDTSYQYRLDQIHCHWGCEDEKGSEHNVDGRYYSAEIHFVHYNIEKYQTMSKAARMPDGLVVVGVFLDAKDHHNENSELKMIVENLESIKTRGDHTFIEEAFKIENLLPTNRSYWSYQGSLTTPPYFESVTWFMLKNPICCTRSQLKKFRNLKSSFSNGNVIEIETNHRKVQALNGRTLINYDELASDNNNNP